MGRGRKGPIEVQSSSHSSSGQGVLLVEKRRVPGLGKENVSHVAGFTLLCANNGGQVRSYARHNVIQRTKGKIGAKAGGAGEGHRGK